MPFERITFTRIGPPARQDINAELQWLGAILGLFGERDKDSSCFRVFVTLVQASNEGVPVSSDEIAHSTELARGTVVHHLNKLRDAGLVHHTDSRYALAGDSVADVVARIQRDLQELLDLSQLVAEDIDRKLGR